MIIYGLEWRRESYVRYELAQLRYFPATSACTSRSTFRYMYNSYIRPRLWEDKFLRSIAAEPDVQGTITYQDYQLGCSSATKLTQKINKIATISTYFRAALRG